MKKILRGKKRNLEAEQPQLPYSSFGVSLDFLRNRDGTTIPKVLDRLCCYLKQNGIAKQGLFRVNGNVRVVRNMKEEFDETGDADLEEVNDQIIAACASLLKQFLRELTEPIIPMLYQEILLKLQEMYCRDNEKLIPHVREVLKQLPDTNREVLEYLFEFMLEISTKSEINKMTPTNLAVVFGPSLFRCGDGLVGASDQGLANGILMMMLGEYENLFHHIEEEIKIPPLPPAYFQRNELMWDRPNLSKISKRLIKETIQMSGLEERLHCTSSERDTQSLKDLREEAKLRKLKREKLELQKFLLSYEKYNGRPTTTEERSRMREPYTRYRELKQRIAAHTSKIYCVMAEAEKIQLQ